MTIFNINNDQTSGKFIINRNTGYVKPKNNYANNIRTTLITDAIKQGKYDIYSNTFNEGFPQTINQGLCDQKLTSIYAFNKESVSLYYNPIASSPASRDKSFVGGNFDPNACSIDFNNSSSSSSGGLNGGDFQTDSSSSSSDTINESSSSSSEESSSSSTLDSSSSSSPETEEPQFCYTTEPTLVNLDKNYDTTIYGYAFYVDSQRNVDIPNIGSIEALCWGGHVCCRTEFTPTLLMGDNVIIGDSKINLNNYIGCSQSTDSVSVPGFVDMTGYERSSAFQFNNIDPSRIIESKFFLSCDLSNCHNAVTMVVLVAKNLDTNDYEIIFSGCVSACLDVEVGKVIIPEGTPIQCDQTQDGGNTEVPQCDPPPANCDYLSKSKAVISFDALEIPFDLVGDQGIKDRIDNAMLTPFIGSLSPDLNGIGVLVIQKIVDDTIEITMQFVASNNGLGFLDVTVSLGVRQTASAYPYLFGVNYTSSISTDDFCNFNKSGGSITTSNDGVSGPFATADGRVFINIF